MPANSKAQFRLMKAIETSPEVAKRVGMSSKKASEYTSGNVKGRSYAKLPEVKKARGGSCW